MPDAILGLLTTDKFAAESDYFYSHRREILHQYPQGNSPLTGILSMIGEEETPSQRFNWWEKLYTQPRTTMRGTNPLTSTAPSTGDADDGTNLPTGAKTTADVIYLKVASTARFNPGLILSIPKADGTTVHFHVRAVQRGVNVGSENGYLTLVPIRAYTAAATDDANGNTVTVIGSAHGEGARGDGVTQTAFRRPYDIHNQTQIFRTPMSFSGTALQEGLKYDDTGPYKEKAKDTVIDHMTDLERSIIFGRRSTTERTSLDGSDSEVVRTMSGIIEFLELWDAGSTGLNIDGSTYAPYSHRAAVTLDTDDEKRIIANSSGNISVSKWEDWAERVGRYHTNKTNEKLVLCGSGAMLALNKMFRQNSTFNVKVGEKAYGLNFTTMTTPFGDFHFMTHPLFTENPDWRYWSLILDVHSIKYRPLTSRDTKLLKNRQNNGDDRRKDEYLTEAGIEFWHPRNSMLIKNVRDYAE